MQLKFEIGSHFVIALVNGDVCHLNDWEQGMIEGFDTGIVASNPMGHWVVHDHTEEFSRCEITRTWTETTLVEYVIV